jgi:hypothetical protein
LNSIPLSLAQVVMRTHLFASDFVATHSLTALHGDEVISEGFHWLSFLLTAKKKDHKMGFKFLKSEAS